MLKCFEGLARSAASSAHRTLQPGVVPRSRAAAPCPQPAVRARTRPSEPATNLLRARHPVCFTARCGGGREGEKERREPGETPRGRRDEDTRRGAAGAAAGGPRAAQVPGFRGRAAFAALRGAPRRAGTAGKVRRGAAVPSHRVLGPAGEGRAAVGACALHTPALSPPDRVDPRLMPSDSSPRPRSPSPFLLPSRPLLPRSSAGFNKRQDPSFLSFESKRCRDWLKRGAHGVFAKIFPNNTRPSLPKFLGKRALSGKTMTENKSVVGVPVGIPGVSTRLRGSPSQALLLIRRLIRGAGDLPRGNGGGTGLPSPRHWGLC